MVIFDNQMTLMIKNRDLYDGNFDLKSALFLACQGYQDYVGHNMTYEQINVMAKSYIIQAKAAREDVG